ncbi:MAG: T9SS type A sorting domain-containing protein [Bacteroidetes bacterium]|nr:T9SS type A sorting domain-containing protein [Bacteroidota bacterium]
MKKITIILTCYLLPFTSFAQWSAIGSGSVGYPIYDFQEWNGKLYITLDMWGYNYGGICSYDGTNIDSLGSGFDNNGSPFSLAVYNNELFAGGGQSLGPPPQIPCSFNIAKWNDTSWSCVGAGGPNDIWEINAMAVYNGELYVGGKFQNMGGVNAASIARWDGTQWKNVGTGFPNNEDVYCMTVYKGELYVGGMLGLPGGPNNYYNLVRWNGTKWDSTGGKIGGQVSSLVVDSINDVLYMGGGITDVAGIPCWSVAKWDGINLSAPGMGITNGANGMAMYQNKLVVGGFWTTGSNTDTILATWDGTYWCAIIPGPNSTVKSMEVYNGELYIGGYFDTVATIPARHIVKWSGNLCPNSGVNEITGQIKFKVFPNPAKNNITIETEENKNFIARITNPLGQKVAEKKFEKRIEVDVSGFGKGLFLVEVTTSEGRCCNVQKVVIQ